MVKVKTSELEGASLDWAVCRALFPNIEGVKPKNAYRWLMGERGGRFSSQSLDSDEVIERHVWSVHKVSSGKWLACAGNSFARAFGGTLRVAAMRAMRARLMGRMRLSAASTCPVRCRRSSSS